MRPVSNDVPLLGFVASETSLCDELETAAAHCGRSGQQLVVNSTQAVQIARDLLSVNPRLVVLADLGHWRREIATSTSPLADVDNLLGLDGWCRINASSGSGVHAYAPAKFIRAADRAARQALLTATEDLPTNVTTLIPTDAAVLDASRRGEFFDDLEATQERAFTFIFADRTNPLGRYQRLAGLRLLLEQHPGSGIVQTDPLVAADALAHGAGWVGVGASSSRRLPTRPGDPTGGRNSAGFLPGLFLLELLELRSPMIYADWFANSRSPFCATCGRALDLFEPHVEDKVAIVSHNLHEVTDHVDALLTKPIADRRSWLNAQRLAAHARHLALNPALGDMKLNATLRHLLELDDPQLRTLTSAGVWK